MAWTGSLIEVDPLYLGESVPSDNVSDLVIGMACVCVCSLNFDGCPVFGSPVCACSTGGELVLVSSAYL